MDKPQGFIICRRGSDPLKPEYVRGYECAICKKGLQVSPEGLKRARAENLLMLCNPCGLDMGLRLEAAGQTLDKQYSEGFLRSFRSYIEKGEVP